MMEGGNTKLPQPRTPLELCKASPGKPPAAEPMPQDPSSPCGSCLRALSPEAPELGDSGCPEGNEAPQPGFGHDLEHLPTLFPSKDQLP
mmetsp:Transcript_62713/g.118685  ORF Transcript_62713/g.118685 Transcript_62713/m.118685 type:complete len:89 (+) Transcript_62713:33-299(+)